MDIKATKKVIVGTSATPLRIGDVATNVDDAEAKALISVGYASEASAKDVEAFKARIAAENKARGDAPSNKGKDTSKTDNGDDLAAILDGTVPEVVAKLDTLTVEQLVALRSLEAAGKGRAGVLDAIAEYDLGE